MVTPGTMVGKQRILSLIWLGICLLVAFTVRSHALGGQSMWWDESLSLHRAQSSLADILANRITLTDGVTQLPTTDNHPQLYFLLLALMVRLLGNSEFALRYLSLAFGILLTPLIYITGRRLLGEWAGRFAALVATLSPMYLWYSQEARMYTMAPFVSLLSFYALLRVLDHDELHRSRWIAIYTLATVSMLLTHYLTFLTLSVQVVIILLAAVRSSRFRRWMWPLILVFAAAAAILAYGVAIMPPPAPQGGFSFVSLPVLARDVLNSFSLGLSVDVDDVIILDLLFLAVALSGLLLRPSSPERLPLPAALLLLLYLAIPLLFTYVGGYVRPFYMNSRHLIIITPAFYLLLGAGIVELSARRALCVAISVLMLAGIIYSWSQFFSNPIYRKDDHRAWGSYLRAYVQPGDIVIVDPPHTNDLYQYYAGSQAPWIGLPALSDPSVATTRETLNRLSAQYRNIWVALTHTPPWGDPDRIVEKWLDQTLTKTDEREFHTYASAVRVARYTTRPQRLLAMPPITLPTDITLDNKLTFLGYDVINIQDEPGHALSYSLYWRLEQPMSEDIKVSLRLVDENGQVWAQADPLMRSLKAGRQSEGTLLREDVSMLVPLATPPGTYKVDMVVYPANTGQPLLATGGVAPIALGQAHIIRPQSPPPVHVLPLTSRVQGHAAEITLLGVQMSSDPLSQGDTLAVEAYWRAAAQPKREYMLRMSLLNRQGHVLARHSYPIAGLTNSTLTWQKGDVVRGQYRLVLPRDLPAGRYVVRLALEDASTGQVTPLQPTGLAGLWPGVKLDIAHVAVNERVRILSAPSVAYPLSVNLGDQVTFLGYDLAQPKDDVRLAPGQAISLTIYLQARRPMDRPYWIFLHVVDADGRLWKQGDAPAGGERYPTSLWLPGEVVSNTLTVTLPHDLPVTRLTAIAGLYDPTSSARLPISGSSPLTDYIALFDIQIVHQ